LNNVRREMQSDEKKSHGALATNEWKVDNCP